MKYNTLYIFKNFILLLFVIIPTNCHSQEYLNLRTYLNQHIGSNKTITLQHSYYLLDLSGTQQAYIFNDIHNTVIDGNGATIICNRQTRAFDFNNCSNVTFKNITIDYDPLCFTQGVITKISSDKKNWTVRIHNGYPIEGISNKKVCIFDSETRQLKKNFKTYYATSFLVSDVVNNIVTLEFNTVVSNISSLKVGDLVVLDIDGKGKIRPHTIFASYCENMIFDNVTIYSSNSFSYLENDCNNTKYSNCKITRKLDDKYLESPRLRSGNADGIHSKHAVIGPTIENCTIDYNADDNIAICGKFYPIYKVDKQNKKIYILSSDVTSEVRVLNNDPIVCVDNNGSIKGECIALNKNKTSITSSEIESCISLFESGLHNQNQYTNSTVITLNQWIEGLKPGDVIYSKLRVGNNFTVRNNNIGFTRARGILIKASDGIIENNHVEGCELAGIVLTPEFYWMSSGCSSNVKIKNNTIKEVLFAQTSKTQRQPGAISVSFINGTMEFAPPGVFNNIDIENNKIIGCPLPNIVLSSVSGIKLANNSFEPNYSMIREHGSKFGVKNNDVIWSINTTDEGTHSSETREDNAVIIHNDRIVIHGTNLLMIENFVIYNINGEIINSIYRHSKINSSTNIYTNHYPNGYYIISYTKNGIEYALKFIIKNNHNVS